MNRSDIEHRLTTLFDRQAGSIDVGEPPDELRPSGVRWRSSIWAAAVAAVSIAVVGAAIVGADDAAPVDAGRLDVAMSAPSAAADVRPGARWVPRTISSTVDEAPDPVFIVDDWDGPALTVIAFDADDSPWNVESGTEIVESDTATSVGYAVGTAVADDGTPVEVVVAFDDVAPGTAEAFIGTVSVIRSDDGRLHVEAPTPGGFTRVDSGDTEAHTWHLATFNDREAPLLDLTVHRSPQAVWSHRFWADSVARAGERLESVDEIVVAGRPAILRVFDVYIELEVIDGWWHDRWVLSGPGRSPEIVVEAAVHDLGARGT